VASRGADVEKRHCCDAVNAAVTGRRSGAELGTEDGSVVSRQLRSFFGKELLLPIRGGILKEKRRKKAGGVRVEEGSLLSSNFGSCIFFSGGTRRPRSSAPNPPHLRCGDLELLQERTNHTARTGWVRVGHMRERKRYNIYIYISISTYIFTANRYSPIRVATCRVLYILSVFSCGPSPIVYAGATYLQRKMVSSIMF